MARSERPRKQRSSPENGEGKRPAAATPADTDVALNVPAGSATPLALSEEQALRGYWARFPVSPEPFALEVEAALPQKDFFKEGDSFKLSRRLDQFVARAEKLTAGKRFAEAQALLRGWVTVVIELMRRADDSYGSIGMSFEEGFKAYLDLPLPETGIDEQVFFHDLLGLLIWEDYGLTDDETEGYFARLSRPQGDCCLEFLERQVAGLKAECRPYQSEKALTLLGQVAAEQDRFELFESLARRMGTREWRRIVRLVDRAVKKRRRELATSVFEAALTPGPHQDFLARKFEQLRGGRWNPDPRK
jgi:hypothetical protein